LIYSNCALFALEYLGFDLFLAFNHMGMLFFREEERRKLEKSSVSLAKEDLQKAPGWRFCGQPVTERVEAV
jgi:hypothetical protein